MVRLLRVDVTGSMNPWDMESIGSTPSASAHAGLRLTDAGRGNRVLHLALANRHEPPAATTMDISDIRDARSGDLNIAYEGIDGAWRLYELATRKRTIQTN
jgi:hypothetical protein